MNKFFIIALLAILSGCSREKSVKDPAWRVEALKIGTDICEKLNSCAANQLTNVTSEIKTFALQKSSAGNCQEKFKKSRVYKLQKYPPELIKSAARDCYTEIMALDCDAIAGNKFENKCGLMQKMQAGSEI